MQNVKMRCKDISMIVVWARKLVFMVELLRQVIEAANVPSSTSTNYTTIHSAKIGNATCIRI